MTMDYKYADELVGYQIEPGDIVKLPDGEVVQVFKVNEQDTYTEIIYLDDYLEEELSFHLPDNERVQLFVYDDQLNPRKGSRAQNPHNVKLRYVIYITGK